MTPEIHEIGKNFYLIKSKEKDFHRNIYIKKFVGPHGESINMVMDPGTALDYPSLSKATKELIGGIKNIHIIFLSHQDPDVSSNISPILASAPKAMVFTSIDTWRLVKMYGIPEQRFKPVESFKNDVLKIKRTGTFIQFVPARYCHFRGAYMFYDHESRILFSGDFMAGLNTKKDPGIYANEESWEGISLFHQIYMPTQKALRATVDRIGLLSPPPEVIAPQHGDVVAGEFLAEFLTRLSSLSVGVDLEEGLEAEKESLILALTSFMDMLEMLYPEVHSSLLDTLTHSGDFTTVFDVAGGTIKGVKLIPSSAIHYFWKALAGSSPEETHDELRGMFISSLNSFGLEIPPSLKEEEKKEGSIDLTKMFG